MRILQFRSTFTFAGPEVTLLRLDAPLRRLGISQKIVAYYRRRPPEPAVHRLIEEGRRLGVDAEQWEDDSRISWKTLRRLEGELKRGAYELIVTHDYKTDVMGYFAARRAGIPCLAVSHGYHFSLRRMRLYRLIDLRILRRFPRVVAVAKVLRDELIAGGLSPGRVSVISNPIDVPSFADGADERGAAWRLRLADSGALVVVTVARLAAEKGFEDLFVATTNLRTVFPQVRVWVVGDGPLHRRLAARICDLGLDGIVSLLGHQRDVAGLMAAADVVVSASLSEGLSIALLEAMALAKPVVATRVGGTEELIVDGQTGWLVPPRQPDIMARTIAEVLRNPSGAAHVAARAREHVAARFAMSDIAAQMADMFRHVSALGT